MMYVVYERATGVIIKNLFCPEFSLDANVPHGCSAIQGEDDGTLRVNLATHTLEPKDPVPFTTSKSVIEANEVDAAVIGAPAGTVAVLDGERYELSMNAFVFRTDLPGSYRLTLQHPLHLDTIVEITAI